MCANQGWQTFSGKNQTRNILGFAGYLVSVTTTYCCCHSIKTVMGQYVNKWVWLYSNKTLFTKITAGQIFPLNCRLPTPILDCYFWLHVKWLGLNCVWHYTTCLWWQILPLWNFRGSSTSKTCTTFRYLTYFYIKVGINHASDQFSLFALVDRKLRAKVSGWSLAEV